MLIHFIHYLLSLSTGHRIGRSGSCVWHAVTHRLTCGGHQVPTPTGPHPWPGPLPS